MKNLKTFKLKISRILERIFIVHKLTKVSNKFILNVIELKQTTRDIV